MKLYGRVENNKVIENPRIVPSVIKLSNGKQVSGVYNSDIKIKRLGYREADILAKPPNYNSETQKLVIYYEVENNKVVKKYKVESKNLTNEDK